MGPSQIMLMSFSWTRSFDSRTYIYIYKYVNQHACVHTIAYNCTHPWMNASMWLWWSCISIRTARLLTAPGGVGSCLRGARGILLFLGHRAGQGAAQVTKRSAQPFQEVEGAIELLEHDQFLKVYLFQADVDIVQWGNFEEFRISRLGHEFHLGNCKEAKV